MLKSLFLFTLLILEHLNAENITHWIEAEDYPGNSKIIRGKEFSGNACVEGKNYYEMVKGIPLPQDRKSYNIWAYCWSDVPAKWYLHDKNMKPHNWFTTEKAETWQWIKIGQTQGKELDIVRLQEPVSNTMPSATGRIDAVVITQIDKKEPLEDLFRQRIQKSSNMSALPEKPISSSRNIANCPFIKTKPIIDGKLNDEAWKQAQFLKDFILFREETGAKEKTSAYICCDDKNLYIAAELFESQMSFIRKIKTIRNDEVWTDDCLEIFIDSEFSQKDYAHFIINPLGTRQDNLSVKIDQAEVSEKQTSLDWTAKTSQTDDRWIVEIAIPWEIIAKKCPAPRSILGFNIARQERPSGEVSSWSNLRKESGFHQPDKFGIVSIGSSPLRLTTIDTGTSCENLKLTLESDIPITASVQIMLSREKSKISSTSQNIAVAAQAPTEVSVPLDIKKPGAYKLNIKINCQETIAYDISIPFKTYSDNLISVAWPPEIRNQTLHIAKNTVQHCFFILANHSLQTAPNPKLLVSVPEGIEILNPSDSLLTIEIRYYPIVSIQKQKSAKNNYTDYVFELGRGLKPRHIEKAQFYNSVLLFFKTNEYFQAGDIADIYYHIESGKQIEDENLLKLKILPEIKGKQPKESLIYLAGGSINAGPHTWGPYVRTLKDAGFNAFSCVDIWKDSDQSTYDYVAKMKAAGITPINGIWWFWWNHEHRKKHPEDLAINYNGETSKIDICPSVLLANDAALLKETFKERMNGIEKGIINGYHWDLEGPECWNICFCPRCISKFKEFANIQKEDMLTAQIIKRKYPREWVNYCCLQSSLICKYLQDEVHKRNPKALFGIYSGLPGFTTQERYRVDWDNVGKYIDFATPSYYSSNESALDHTFSDGMKSIILKIKNSSDKPVKVLPALTPGYWRNESLQPSAELMKIQFLKSFAAGCDGIHFWWWGPFDGKYYQKLSEATSFITDFEDFFTRGKETPEKILLKHTFGNSISSSCRFLDDVLLVMVFNHNSTETRELQLSIENMSEASSAINYYQSSRPDKLKDIKLSVRPLEMSVVIVGEDKKIKKYLTRE